MQDDQEYLKAFRGEEEPVADAPVVPDSAAEGDTETEAVGMTIDPVAAVADAADEAGLNVGEEAAPEGEMPPMVEAEPSAVAEPDGDEAISPEDMQRQKSWEGRLKKREEELAAREAAIAPTATDEEIAAIKESLANDFGEELVDMISKLVAYEAKKLSESAVGESINPIAQRIDEAIASVTEAFNSMHFGAIADAHEDFQEVVSSPEFGAYVDSLPEEQKAKVASIMQNGRASQVIAVLNDYKKSLATAGADTASVDDALDAASAVRGSAPVSLPGRAPVGDDDEYKAAWDSM